MADRAGGKNEHQVINEILADVAWGTINENGEWVWDGQQPSVYADK